MNLKTVAWVDSTSYLISRGNLKSSIGDGESASKLLWGDIGSVLHRHILVDGANQTPELFLDQLGGHHLQQAHDPNNAC